VPETFTPSGGTGSWTTLDSAYKHMGWYPFTFPLPSGNVFYAGPAGGVTTFVLDLGVTPPRWKSQTYPSLHAGGSAVMYEPGSVLKAGSPLTVAPSNKSERIRLQANDEALDDPPWQLHGPLESVRVNHNLTVLPNGKVLVSGGTTDVNETVYLRQPELWDPATGNWTGGAGDDSLAISYIGRGYHSSAILLPDGRVMTAGSNGTPGADSSLIYCPPYLFTTGGAAASRPSIDSTVVQVNYSQDFVIKTGASQNIAQVVLMRPGAATHGFDQGQFRVPLAFTQLTGAPRLVVKGPANACIAPPGNYLLFIVKSNPDTPSIAQWVTVGNTTADATKPRTVDNMYVDIVGTSEVWLAWTAPGDDVNAGTACSYDFRQQLTPISSDAAFAGAERPVPQPITQLGGTLQSHAVAGLSPCTQYYFSAKARDDWANWSLLGNSAEGTTSCGGGGGFARAPAGAPIASLRTAASSAASATRARSLPSGAGTAEPRPEAEPAGREPSGGALAAEMRRVAGAPEWTVYPLDAVEAAALAAEDPAAGIVMQSRDPGGAWVTTGRRYPSTGGQVFGLRGFRDPGRAVFLGDYTLQQAYGTVGAGAAAGQAFDVVTARHSRLGDLTAAMESSGVYDSSLEAGDTLRLTYGATDQPARPAEDWFLLVAPAGSAGASGLRRGPAEGVGLPTAFALYGNQPNPFRGTTVIPFDLPIAVPVRIEVYDVLGRRVATLADAPYPAGFHSVEWDLREQSGVRARPGIYLYRMTAGAFRAKGKMSVIE
jgi:galactose oxidase-like protein